MIMTVPAPLRRGGAIVLLLGLLAALWGFGVGPLLDQVRDYREIVDRSFGLGAKQQELARTRAELERRVRELGQAATSSSYLLEGSSHALVAAQLQAQVKTVIQQSKASLKSTDVLSPEEEGQYQRVPIRVVITASVESLKKIFYELERSKAYLFIENVDVSAHAPRGASDETSEVMLDVRFDVFGYMRGQA